jgi:serine/threonine protein kinase
MTNEDNSNNSSGKIGVGTILNGIFEIDERLASGGMGEVYRGHNIATSDPVAIKVVLNELAKDETILALFYKEARILNTLHHPSIVRYGIFTIDPVSQRPYLVTEFIDGPSLAERLAQGPLTPAETKLLVGRVAGGLDAAHRAGVIHRDISPDNIILAGGDVEAPKIIDFGIARAKNVGTGTLLEGKFAGKYNFVSPEQLGLFGGNVTEASDVYSLGLLTVNALRGEPIDMNGTQFEIIEKRRSVPDLSGLDPEISDVVELMLQPNPADRTVTMADIAGWFAPQREVSNPPRRFAPIAEPTDKATRLGDLKNGRTPPPSADTRVSDIADFSSPPNFPQETGSAPTDWGEAPSDLTLGNGRSGGMFAGHETLPQAAMRDESDLPFLAVSPHNPQVAGLGGGANRPTGGVAERPSAREHRSFLPLIVAGVVVVAGAVVALFYLPGLMRPENSAVDTLPPPLQPSAASQPSPVAIGTAPSTEPPHGSASSSPQLQPAATAEHSPPAAVEPAHQAQPGGQDFAALLDHAENTAAGLQTFLNQCGPDCPPDIAQRARDRLDTVKGQAAMQNWIAEFTAAGQDATRLQAFIDQCRSDCPPELATQARSQLAALNTQATKRNEWAGQLALAGQDPGKLQSLLDQCGASCPHDIARQVRDRLDASSRLAARLRQWGIQLDYAGQDPLKLQAFLDQCGTDCPPDLVRDAKGRLDALGQQAARANQWAIDLADAGKEPAKLRALIDRCGADCPADIARQARERLDAAGKQAALQQQWTAELALAADDKVKLQAFLDRCGSDCPADLSGQARDRLDASNKQAAARVNRWTAELASAGQDAGRLQSFLDRCGADCPENLSLQARNALSALSAGGGEAGRLRDWIRNFDGGDCFFARGTSAAPRQVEVEGMGSEAEPFDKMDAAFQAKFGFEPNIQVRPLTASQCSVPNFLTALAPALPPAMRINLESDHVKSGETLKGSVDGINRSDTTAYLIDSDGLVHPIDQFFKRQGTTGRIGIDIVEKEPAKPLQELVLILASDGPVPGSALSGPTPAKTFFPQLLKTIRDGGLQVDYSFDFFLLGGNK